MTVTEAFAVKSMKILRVNTEDALFQAYMHMKLMNNYVSWRTPAVRTIGSFFVDIVK